MRENLRAERKAQGLTQQETANMLHVSLRYYQQIEAGDREGSIQIWDMLEDAFGINQRVLRQMDHALTNNLS